jgi:hypothetical protein
VSKHAELYTRPFIPPQDDLWNAMPARRAAHAPALRMGSSARSRPRGKL